MHHGQNMGKQKTREVDKETHIQRK